MENGKKAKCACCQGNDGGCDSASKQPTAKSRRAFLGVIVGVINVGLVAVFGGPILGFLGAPLKHKANKKWVSIADFASLPDGQATSVTYTLKVKDGYHLVDRSYSVFLRRTGEEVICMDPSCTHLGCKVDYQVEKDRFLCPCHGGVFDAEGKVVSGPPPKQLDRYELKVENGKVWLHREV